MKSWRHAVTILVALAALAATAVDERRLTIYTAQSSYSAAVIERDGRPYVALFELLAPLGSASARQDGDKWKLKFNDQESEFRAGKNRAKVNRKNIDLAGPFLVENGRGLLPLPSLASVLPRLLPAPVELREPAHRLFIGGAVTVYSTEFHTVGPRLVLHFSAPVNPSISTEPGKIRMVFAREPLVGSPGTQNFDDKVIRAANFSEHDGLAELVIQAGAPMVASFSEQNRTITITPAPPVRAQAAPPATTPSPVPAPAPAPAIAPATPSAPQSSVPVIRARPTVVIDPGHGGDDRGAALSETLAEKDVTLAWARKLRAALDQKGIPATLLREGDISLTFDQRAALANAARPLVFITLHAGTSGTGVRIYTAHLGERAPRAGSFLPWNAAQASHLDGSRAVAGSVAAEMNKRSIPVGTAPVLLRPLNNVAASAVAIEVMPPGGDVAGVMNNIYQQSVCAAIADGIAANSKPSSSAGEGAGSR